MRVRSGWAPLLATWVAASSARADFHLPPVGDVTPPTVTIVAPRYGQHFSDPMLPVHVRIEAMDPEAQPGDETRGISEVWLEIDAEEREHVSGLPLTLPAVVTTGAHSIRAHAVDYEGNQGDSEPVVITMFAASDTSGTSTSSGTGSSTGTGSGGAASSGTAAAPENEATDRGCSCELAGPREGGWLACALLMLRPRARRRADSRRRG